MTGVVYCALPKCPGEGKGVLDEEGLCEACGRSAADYVDEPPPVPEQRALSVEPAPVDVHVPGRLGTGLADVPSAPVSDPTSNLLSDPVVPESRRWCPNSHEVGRSADGSPAPLKGRCPTCEAVYDFTRTLARGELVAGQYEVEGLIAHGGLGGVYLAVDHHLESRVVLKGLLDPANPAALRAARDERHYLVAVNHPNIVDIHNYVKHRDRSDGAEHDYLVMEYVGGVALSDLSHPAWAGGATMPAHWAIPFALEILSAFDYLHSNGMVYCDLKPSNVIQFGKRLKLIDLGAMRRIGRTDGDIWRTPGYSAPEIGRAHPPDVASDLYTVGRTLAVLTLGFRPAEASGGETREVPLPPRPAGFNESLYLLLQRACARDPAERFDSAAAMAEQLTGVLRQIRAELDGQPYPAVSARFGLERGALASALADSADTVFARPGAEEARRVLPVPQVADPSDLAGPALVGLALQPAARTRELIEALPATPEARLARIRLAAELGARDAAAQIERARGDFGDDWRLDWYRGVAALGGAPAEAAEHFGAVRRRLPGELAPMLALAVCEESAGTPPRRAAELYRTVWRTDRNHTSAAFGLARTSDSAVERVAAMAEGPHSSSHYLDARQALIAERVRGRPDLEAVVAAGAHLDELAGLDAARAALIEAEVWRAALAAVEAGAEDPGRSVRGVALTRNAIGQAYEAVLRRVSAGCASPLTRWALVGAANRARPRTWL
ncbi:serine/threonine-protein kinase [Glycomyces tenuis]|uniref:serine/threonine-protein kinase n=1 Tax=Glycomyces tenuis TaxID=58116 RepID=UPI0006903E68|nr:serine/threonine-protein kinase [Glycomyces tenuis]